jgi:hypothetical protein
MLETDSGEPGHVVAGRMFWGEVAEAVGYRSFLIPDYDLPAFRPDRPVPSGPAVLYSS